MSASSAGIDVVKSEPPQTPPAGGSRSQANPAAAKNHLNINNLNSKPPKQKSKTNDTNNSDLSQNHHINKAEERRRQVYLVPQSMVELGPKWAC
jgi:hypothetical protein